MNYPKFLKPGSKIGVIAPSFGIFVNPYLERFENALKKFKNLGYDFRLAAHTYGNVEKARSIDAKTRAQEFMDMYLDQNIDFIFSAAGGELMMEILPFINFTRLQTNKPKFIMGSSDNTCLTLPLNILADVATIYGYCLPTFGMANWDQSIQESYEIITGKRDYQISYKKYELEKNEEPLGGFNLTEDNSTKTLRNHDECFSGRLIGGCFDVIRNLLATSYADISSYQEKYRNDGFILFLDSCDMNLLDQYRALWQLKEAGWFKYCNGVLYGRPLHKEEQWGISYQEMLEEFFMPLQIPVIYDCDFGHVDPSWTIISGSYADIKSVDNVVTIAYHLK